MVSEKRNMEDFCLLWNLRRVRGQDFDTYWTTPAWLSDGDVRSSPVPDDQERQCCGSSRSRESLRRQDLQPVAESGGSSCEWALVEGTCESVTAMATELLWTALRAIDLLRPGA